MKPMLYDIYFINADGNEVYIKRSVNMHQLDKWLNKYTDPDTLCDYLANGVCIYYKKHVNNA